MRKALFLLVSLVSFVALAACGPGIQGGPTMNNRVGDDASDAPPAIQSNDVLARDAVTKTSKVKHILVGWKDLGAAYDGHMDARAQQRTRAEADALAEKLLGRVRAGEAIEPLMAEFSEDQGSNQSGDAYDVTPESQYVFEFKRLSLRLNVGEAGLVLTQFGWHIIKRLE
jgi:peptidyl-prolyl cis-trans isomerase D